MIIVTGSLAYDYIMEFPGKFGDHILPEHTHNVNLSFIVDKFAKHRGGTAGNVSYTLGLLKTPHILFSYAGNDFTEYKMAFDQLGIDTSHIQIDKTEHTATGFAMTDADSNQIWGYYYGAAVNNPRLDLRPIAHREDLVLIGPQGAEGSMNLVRQCVELGVPYMFDPGFILTQVSNEDLTLGATHATYVIGNEYEMNIITERVGSWQEIKGDKTIITTLGEKGAVIESKGQTYTIPVVKVTVVSSTTGAGDSWRGGFLAGLSRGLDLQTCGQLGAVAGSFAVEKYGTQEFVFHIQAFEERYRQAFGTMVTL